MGNKLGMVASLMVALLMFVPRAEATCWQMGNATGPTFNANCGASTCNNTGPGGTAQGTAYYDYGNYCADPVGCDPFLEDCTCTRWDDGCYYHTFECDTTCANADVDEGGGGLGGVPTCNPGETFGANVPEQIQCIQGEAACRLQNDGTGGNAGEYVPNLSYGCTDEQLDEGKRACRLGKCNNKPKGTHVSSSCTQSTGWSCDIDNYDTALRVDLYQDGPYNGGGTFIGSTTANQAGSPSGQCGGTTNHNFTFTTPESLKDGVSHDIYAYGINIGGGSNILLSQTPKSITCAGACTAGSPENLTMTPGVTEGSVEVNWTPGNPGDPSFTQRLLVGEIEFNVNYGCTGAYTDCHLALFNLDSSVDSYTVTGLTPGVTYYYRVVTFQSSSCLAYDAAQAYETPEDVENLITGVVTVNDDGSCVPGDPATWPVDIAWGTDEAVYNADGSYTLTTSVAGTYDLILYGVPDGYVCAPCAPCTVYVGAGPGGTNIAIIEDVDPEINGPGNFFYLTPARQSWFQIEGAGLYAGSTLGGVTVRSLIPPSQEFILPGALGSVGALMRASGNYDVESEGGTLSSTGWNAVTRYRGKTLNYSYFAAREGVTLSQGNDWVSDNLNEPGDDGREFWYIDPFGTGAISDVWNVSGGENYVVFVDGDLEINENIIVDSNSFLAFIVRGDIEIDPDVTTVQGLYVADGVITTESAAPADDVQLTAEGSFVGWTGVSLRRDLGDDNLDTPAELFVYRPDLLLNMPLKMRTYALEWTEVVPGTFDL